MHVAELSTFFSLQHRVKSLKFHFHSNRRRPYEYEPKFVFFSFGWISYSPYEHTKMNKSSSNVYNENQINLNFIIYVNMKSFSFKKLNELRVVEKKVLIKIFKRVESHFLSFSFFCVPSPCLRSRFFCH